MKKSNVAYDLEGHKYNLLAFVLVLLFGSFTMSISQSSMSTAYPTMMKSFGISASTVQWLTTGLMIVMCVMMPASPWLLNNVKFKRLFIGILLTFDVGTLIIFIAPNFLTVIVGRTLEAIAMGVLFPSFQSVLLYITPEKRRGSIMGLAGLVLGSALACGPVVSGIILNFTSGWRGLFMFFMVVITIMLILSLFTIKDVMPYKKSHLDILSIVYSIGLIGILYVINIAGKIGKQNVNLTVIGLILIVSLVLMGLFIHRQFHLKQPLLNLRVMKVFNYDLAIGLTCFSYIALIVNTIIFPLYYQDVLGASKLVSGLAMAPGAIFLSILNPYTGHLTGTIGFKKTMLIGMTMICAGGLVLSIVPAGMGLIATMLITAVIKGGNAFVMMPSVTMGANSLPKNLISHGTALITTMRQILGSVAVVVATLILTNVTSSNSVLGRMVAQLHGFKAVFITFFILEVIGMIMALMIKNPKRATK